jgi:hypothetical protein
MAVRILPDVGLLRQIFDYNPETGEFRHKPRPREMFATAAAFRTWHSRGFVGNVATTGSQGYLLVSIRNKQYLAHRVAYKITYGTEPPPLLDHINMDGRDNRLANLRCASWGQNMMNRPIRSDNPTGAKGVRFRAKTGKYIARIRANGKEHHLGMFDTKEQAHAAYCAASLRLHGEFSRST